jgi:hypothetical protein
MGIRYGWVSRETGLVAWHFVSHVECDGIGGFARLLRERGAEIEQLPQTRHSCRGVIAPLWRLWCDGRKEGKCADRSDWSTPELPLSVGWHLFTEGETDDILSACRRLKVTANSFLLRHLDLAVRPEVRRPRQRIAWMIPVNLRGDIRYPDDTENHVSCIEVRIGREDDAPAIHDQIRRRLARGEHRANFLLLTAGGILGHQAKVDYLKKERAKPAGTIGAFSNLGVWKGGEDGDGWVFCPPVVTGQLLGAGCVTMNGRLGLAVQGCDAGSWMERWVSQLCGRGVGPE